jgi:thiosulfate reductase cytochrome b subunit
MKVEIKDFFFLALGWIVSHYAEQFIPTISVLGFTFFSGWLFVAFLLCYVIWMNSRKKLKKQIKEEILRELKM